MTTVISLKYYGMAGEGRTVTEAKQDAGRKIERALEGSYAPVLLRVGDWQAIVYREPDGWYYKFLPQTAPQGRTDLWGQRGRDTKQEAIATATSHLVQTAWTLEADDAALLAMCDKADRYWMEGWFRTQRQIAVARANGATEEQIRAFLQSGAPLPQVAA